MTQLDMGKDLTALGRVARDLALQKSYKGRDGRIEAIRVYLFAEHESDFLTGDDVVEAAETLQLFDKDDDRRWVGNVLKSWGLVEPTDRFVPSRRKVRHAAPVRVWRWV